MADLMHMNALMFLNAVKGLTDFPVHLIIFNLPHTLFQKRVVLNVVEHSASNFGRQIRLTEV